MPGSESGYFEASTSRWLGAIALGVAAWYAVGRALLFAGVPNELSIAVGGLVTGLIVRARTPGRWVAAFGCTFLVGTVVAIVFALLTFHD